MENPELDKPFTFTELVLSVNELKDNKAPGDYYIATNEITVLLHIDPENPELLVILNK